MQPIQTLPPPILSQNERVELLAIVKSLFEWLDKHPEFEKSIKRPIGYAIGIGLPIDQCHGDRYKTVEHSSPAL